ncbi:related to Endo-1,4-beta-xylanase [Cephalotrichum gorgonifer]|uniref:Endo-1,4-beta-xylanase n=1 Tax=Cephalotrichum gorgonifer TaxID=2041049 RepID=A0AAE8N7H5_9PEZI|nr:related to Endo-1,4-beta-xylanase [Cephalotrichum gorgonifer]
MVSLYPLLSAFLVATGALAGPVPHGGDSSAIQRRQAIQSTPNSQGTHDGFFYSWWSDGASPVNYTNLAGGSYKIEWQPGGNFYGGKGWETGLTERSIQFSGTYEPNGTSYLSVYGWMANPQIEYYIVESHGPYNPTTGFQQHLGTVTCDGSEYDLGRVSRITMTMGPPLLQYWSVRKQKQGEGIVNTGCHFDAWRDAGLELGSHGFQIVATEGYVSSGFAEITVADAS